MRTCRSLVSHLKLERGGGNDEDIQEIVVSVNSSNKQLVPDENIKINLRFDEANIGKGSLDITPDLNLSGVTTIIVTVDDGYDKVEESFEVVIQAVNDKPTIKTLADLTIEEDQSISNLPIELDEGGAADEDIQILEISLESTNPELISPERITLEFEEDETDADKGMITIAPNANKYGKSVITLTISDGANEVKSSFSIAVVPVNDIPIANDIVVELDEDQPRDIQLKGFDVDGDLLEYFIVTNPKKGTFTDFDSTKGTLTYIPNENEVGEDSFSYQINDGTVNSDVAEVELIIKAMNDIPEINTIEDQITVEDGVIKGLKIQANAGGGVDEEGQILEINASTSNPDLVPQENLVIHFPGKEKRLGQGTLDIIPEANESGITHITISVFDGTAAAEISFNLTVSPENDPPTLSEFTNLSILEDEKRHQIEFFADEGGGTDEDIQKLKLSAESSNKDLVADSGILINFNDDLGDAGRGSIDIIPSSNMNGVTTITITVDDGSNKSSNSFQLTVEPVDDNPTISDIGDLNIDEDSAIDGIILLVDEGGGPDEDEQILDIQITSTNEDLVPIKNIIFDYSDDVNDAKGGVLNISLKENQIGSSDISLIVDDGSNRAEESFKIQVTAINDPPTISGLSDIVTKEDNPLYGIQFSVDEGGGIDEDYQAVAIEVSSSNSIVIPTSNITIQFSDGVGDAEHASIDVIPAPNRFGSSKISVLVHDGVNYVKDQFLITVEPVNDLPLAFNYQLTSEPNVPTLGILQGVDPDGGGTLRYAIVESAEKGEVKIIDQNHGLYQYTSGPDTQGTDCFTYKVNDGSDDSQIAKIEIEIRSP